MFILLCPKVSWWNINYQIFSKSFELNRKKMKQNILDNEYFLLKLCISLFSWSIKSYWSKINSWYFHWNVLHLCPGSKMLEREDKYSQKQLWKKHKRKTTNTQAGLHPIDLRLNCYKMFLLHYRRWLEKIVLIQVA